MRILGFALTVLAGVVLPLGSAAVATPDRLAPAVAYAVDIMHASGVPGFAVGVVKGHDIVFTKAYGTADDAGRAVTVDTPFILGSTTKSFTALCVMQLVDAGKVSLDAPVTRYLPGFLQGSRAAAKITVRMLLNQASGMGHAAGDQPMLSDGESGPQAIRDWAMAMTPAALTASGYEYSNANYVVLGAIVEAASGEPFARYLHDHVLKPLGMRHSFTSLAEAHNHGLSSGHRQWITAFEASEVPYPQSFLPAGFLITSVGDMTRYLAMQAGDGSLDGVRIVSAHGLAEMHRGAAAMDSEGKSHYAMGWVRDTFNGLPVVFHDGDTGRFSSIMAIALKDHSAVVILSNGSGWLYAPRPTDAANGAINILEGKTPKNYVGAYTITKVALLFLVGIPVLQLLFLLLALIRRKPPVAAWKTWLPVTLNGALALLFAYAVPRLFFGIPLIELLSSLPAIGFAAVASAVAAVAWLVWAVVPISPPNPSHLFSE